MTDVSINFYEALREMESAKEPFSVTWCKYSESKNTGGDLHTEPRLSFEGKRETEEYELIFFKRPDDQIVSCHLFSLMYYNGKKMIIQ